MLKGMFVSKCHNLAIVIFSIRLRINDDISSGGFPYLVNTQNNRRFNWLCTKAKDYKRTDAHFGHGRKRYSKLKEKYLKIITIQL